jgi:hypothetical protein
VSQSGPAGREQLDGRELVVPGPEVAGAVDAHAAGAELLGRGKCRLGRLRELAGHRWVERQEEEARQRKRDPGSAHQVIALQQ